MGTLYSQRGNALFPTWEHLVPKVGTFTELRINQARQITLEQTSKQVKLGSVRKVTESASQRHTATAAVKLPSIDGFTRVMGSDL